MNFHRRLLPTAFATVLVFAASPTAIAANDPNVTPVLDQIDAAWAAAPKITIFRRGHDYATLHSGKSRNLRYKWKLVLNRAKRFQYLSETNRQVGGRTRRRAILTEEHQVSKYSSKRKCWIVRQRPNAFDQLDTDKFLDSREGSEFSFADQDTILMVSGDRLRDEYTIDFDPATFLPTGWVLSGYEDYTNEVQRQKATVRYSASDRLPKRTPRC
jgi:hypothetical protein